LFLKIQTRKILFVSFAGTRSPGQPLFKIPVTINYLLFPLAGKKPAHHLVN